MAHTNKTIFVTGIGTDVGKTIVSAIIVEALKADYWKPVQAGDLELSDTHKVKVLISNKTTKFHNNAYALQTPMSPHAAASIDNVDIKLDQIIRPKTSNHLVVEGAGGLLVPLNTTHLIADLIKPTDVVILVSRHYLGSINHTLLSLNYLKQKGINNVGIIFSGNRHETTEDIILKMAKPKFIGRVEEEESFTEAIISKYASLFKTNLINL